MEQMRPDQSPYGVEFLRWEFDETDRYARGKAWYFVMTALMLGLLLYSFVSANFLFALIVLMFGLIVYLTSVRGGEPVQVAITDRGVMVGSSFYAHREIEHFWFIYQPPEVKTLYLDTRSLMVPRIALDLAEQDPNQVREALAPYVVEDLTKDEEPLSDVIARVMKL